MNILRCVLVAGVVLFSEVMLSAQSISATLEWDSSLSADVVGYHLYRKGSVDPEYLRLTTAPLAGMTFTDSTAQYGTSYLYRATAVSSTGAESAFSNEAVLDLICRGDVNADRQRDVLDAVQMLNHVVGNTTLVGDSLVAGDLDEDGSITVLDSVRLLNHIVGSSPLPDCIM